MGFLGSVGFGYACLFQSNKKIGVKMIYNLLNQVQTIKTVSAHCDKDHDELKTTSLKLRKPKENNTVRNHLPV